MLNFDLIREAAARIAGRVHRTPVMTSRSFNDVAGCEVFFKCENLQRAGAFKARGATNKDDLRRKTEQGKSSLGYSGTRPSVTFDPSHATAPPPVPESRRPLVQSYFVRKSP